MNIFCRRMLWFSLKCPCQKFVPWFCPKMKKNPDFFLKTVITLRVFGVRRCDYVRCEALIEFFAKNKNVWKKTFFSDFLGNFPEDFFWDFSKFWNFVSFFLVRNFEIFDFFKIFLRENSWKKNWKKVFFKHFLFFAKNSIRASQRT